MKKHHSWKDAILKILEQAGRVLVLRDIYVAMVDHPLVTPYHKESWTLGGQPRYQCWIRQYLSQLVEEGKVCRVSEGMYLFLCY